MIRLLLGLSALLLLSCSRDELPQATTSLISYTENISLDTLFPDTETRAVLHSEKYSFNTTEMLSVTPLNDSEFTVTSFVPTTLYDVTIAAQFDGVKTAFELVILDTIPPHVAMTFAYPDQEVYKGLNGEVVEINPSGGFPASVMKLDFLPTNRLLKMMKEITVDWDMVFHDFDPDATHDMWEPVRPAQARLYTLLMFNTAYLFTQKEYRERFLDEPLYSYVDNATRIVEDSNWLSLEEKELIYYTKIMDKSFNLGVTVGGGLGGGSALGVSNGTLTKQYNYKWDDSLMSIDYLPSSYYTGPHPLYSHEMGHCFGYGHNANMCSTGRRDTSGTEGWEQMYGFPAVSVLLHSKYVHYDLLPISQVEYYRQDDFDFVQPADSAPF